MIRRRRIKPDEASRSSFSIPKRVSILVLTLLLLAIPVVIYFTRYITNQTAYFTSQNFRELATISDQLQGRIQDKRGVFIGALNYELDRKQEPTLTLQQVLQGTDLTILSPPENLESLRSLKQGYDTRRVSMRIEPGSEDSGLVFSFDPPNQELEGVAARISLGDIVRPLIGKRELESIRGSEHEQGFDTVLVAAVDDQAKLAGSNEPRQASKIIFQSPSPELDIDSLDNLVRSDAPDKTIDLKTLRDNTASADVKIADAEYKLYAQPVVLPFATVKSNANPQNSEESHWIVCGLVEASHFRHQTWAFPYTLLITFGFLTVLIALSWPFLKLVFIGPKDRLRLADVYFIAFALLIGSAILTFFVLYGLTYSHSEYVLDEKLRLLSKEIAGFTDSEGFHDGNFQQEIRAVNKQIDEMNKAERPTQAGVSLSIGTGNASGAGLKDLSKDPYPFFDRVAWVDPAGHMRAVGNTGREARPLPANIVRQRDWFTNIINGNSRNIEGGPFWLEPVTSRYSANKTVVVSKPVNDPGDPRKVEYVTALDPSMMSLMKTIVPTGFGYRIIDATGTDPDDDGDNTAGKVLFQSSESQQLKENFFQECDNNRSLRSLVKGRASDFVDVDYKGEGHRLYVAPIQGFPNWSLIVFRDKAPLRTAYLEMLTLSGFIFFLYVSILLIAFTIIYIFKAWTDDRTEWIWPSKEMTPVYQQILSLNLILCVGGLAVIVLPIFRNRPGISIVAIGLLAYGSIVILASRLKLGWILKKVHWTQNWVLMNRLIDRGGGAYVWNVVLLLVLTAVMPAIVSFKAAYNAEMQLFVKHVQFSLSHSLDQRIMRIRNQYATNRVDAANNPSPFEEDHDAAEKLIARRLTDPLGSRNVAQFANPPDVYTNFFYGTKIEPWVGPGIPPSRDFLTTFESFLPFFNESTVETRALSAGKAADGTFGWEEPDGNLAFYKVDTRVKNLATDYLAGANYQIITPLERFGPPTALNSFPESLFLLAWFTGFLFVLYVMQWLARLVVKRTFLLNVTRNLYPSTVVELETTQNLFVVRYLPSASENGATESRGFFSIDLTKDAVNDNWLAQIRDRLRDEPYKKVIIHHFEHGLTDSETNEQKLELLESLLAERKLTVITSAVEPAAYLRYSREDGADADLGERWARAMSYFRKLYSAPRMIGVSESALAELEAALPSNGSISSLKRRQVLELATRVYEECAALPSLEDLSSNIISRLPSEDLDWNRIRREIADRAELYYQGIWNNCSPGERLTLLHLAEDRLLSPNDPDIGPLLYKHLITFAPDLQLMNETFKQFILSRSAHEPLQSKEMQARSASQWEAFKLPLFVAFAAVVAFLIFTQRDLYNSSWTLITAMTTGIPAVFKVISLFQSGSGSGKLFSA